MIFFENRSISMYKGWCNIIFDSISLLILFNKEIFLIKFYFIILFYGGIVFFEKILFV